MAKTRRVEMGAALEARVQRLFMWQGAYAERGLFLRASRGDAKLVTDIDVISHDYNINFHHRRIYAECKGGESVATLDRIVWIRGVKEIVGSEFAYLVLDHCDPSSVHFARSHGIEVLTGDGLAALETALGVPPDFWPGRTNLAIYGPIEKQARDIAHREASEHFARWLSRAQDLWREASHLLFSYGRLNALVSTLSASRQFTEGYGLTAVETEAFRFAIGAMLVRLAQYVVYAASDTLSMTPSERSAYLAERLTAGNLDLEQFRRILESALRMVRATLDQHKISAPISWNSEHMLSAPAYAVPFTTVVERAIAGGDNARLLPLAMELRQFGFSGERSGGAKLLSRLQGTGELTSVVRAFAVQSLGVGQWLLGLPTDSGGSVQPFVEAGSRETGLFSVPEGQTSRVGGAQ